MEKVTVSLLHKKKILKEPIVALTCYDAATASAIDDAVDIALVGDSLANTRLGYPNTLPVSVEEMMHHVKASARGIRHAFLVADMPFQSYEAAPWQASITAGRFIKEGGAQAVKVEGGRSIAKSIEAILKANIPVMGHLGLLPQSFNKVGGYFVRGKNKKEAKAIMADAKLLESLGVFALVLEGIPAVLAKSITKQLKIPTIGIGAGIDCDGQILVLDDVLGISHNPSPKFVKKYANLNVHIRNAIQSYQADVRHKRFPTIDHSY